MPQLNMFEPIEEQIKPSVGNRKLVDYGIHKEDSDYRIHVCYKVMRVYIFPTKAGRSSAERCRLDGVKPKQVYTGDIVTALGYPVPLSYIDGLQWVFIPLKIWQKYPIRDEMSTSKKGALAMVIVREMLIKNIVPLPVQVNTVDDKAIDIRGTDMIVVNSTLRLQVKCDLPGGDRNEGGTGNLFIQIAECNPEQRH